MSIRFALNRTCAPQLALPDFISLATSVGVEAVEIRNDIEGREFHDGTPAAEVRARLQDAGLAVASVNALQRFNEWNPARAKEATALAAYASALRAPGIVLCPVHNEDHGWSKVDAESNLRDGLVKLAPILNDHGLTGYVEPLGMKGSTMKNQHMAVEAVSDVDGWDTYQICFDTFQFFRCEDTAMHYDRIGLTHMSGISRRDLPPEELTEPDRGLVFIDDRVDNIRLLQNLVAGNYSGFISMEPFSPVAQQDPELPARLRASLEYVATLLN